MTFETGGVTFDTGGLTFVTGGVTFDMGEAGVNGFAVTFETESDLSREGDEMLVLPPNRS